MKNKEIKRPNLFKSCACIHTLMQRSTLESMNWRANPLSPPQAPRCITRAKSGKLKRAFPDRLNAPIIISHSTK